MKCGIEGPVYFIYKWHIIHVVGHQVEATLETLLQSKPKSKIDVKFEIGYEGHHSGSWKTSDLRPNDTEWNRYHGSNRYLLSLLIMAVMKKFTPTLFHLSTKKGK